VPGLNQKLQTKQQQQQQQQQQQARQHSSASASSRRPAAGALLGPGLSWGKQLIQQQLPLIQTQMHQL
jgi:hypothetical protein